MFQKHADKIRRKIRRKSIQNFKKHENRDPIIPT